MGNYSKIRKQAGKGRYASGGRVGTSRTGAKTVINIVTPPPAGGMPQPGMAPPVPPAGNSPSPAAAGPVPPAAAAMALGAMQGKPGAPGAFARGGRVKCANGGAASGEGRLKNVNREKRVPKRPSATAK